MFCNIRQNPDIAMVVTTRQSAAASAKRKRAPGPPEPTPTPQPQPQPQSQQPPKGKCAPLNGFAPQPHRLSVVAAKRAKASCLLQQRGVLRSKVYFSCEVCEGSFQLPSVELYGQLSFRENCKLELLEKNLDKHQLGTSHFLCAVRYLDSLDSEVARYEVIDRWRESMPALSCIWRLFRKRRRFMLEMTSVTEEVLQDPSSNLERLLVHSVLYETCESKAAFVHLVAAFLASDGRIFPMPRFPMRRR